MCLPGRILNLILRQRVQHLSISSAQGLLGMQSGTLQGECAPPLSNFKEIAQLAQ